MSGWSERTKRVELAAGSTARQYHFEFNTLDEATAEKVERFFQSIMDGREMLTAKHPELSEEDLEKFKQWCRESKPVIIPRERPVRIHLNDLIKVKLTEAGKEVYWDHYQHSEPRIDEDGYTKFSLWQFIYVYGHCIHLTAPGVIENSEIIYEQED